MSQPDKENGSHNWIKALPTFAQIAGILAGFCITFVALIIQNKSSGIDLCAITISSNGVAALLLGTSAVLFIFAMQQFMRAYECNLWDLPSAYVDYIKKIPDDNDGNAKDASKQSENNFEKKATESYTYSFKEESVGRQAYNFALIFMFLGLGMAIISFSIIIGSFIAILGIITEAWQYFKKDFHQKSKKED